MNCTGTVKNANTGLQGIMFRKHLHLPFILEPLSRMNLP